MKKAIEVAAISAALFFVGGCQTPKQSAPMWEYKILRNPRAEPNANDTAQHDAKLNELGRQGWELISWEPDLWVLKRPLVRTEPRP